MAAVVVVGAASELVEDRLSLSTGQRLLGMAGVGLALLLAGAWGSLHDSDLAYGDRESGSRLARIRHRLRQVFNIPVV